LCKHLHPHFSTMIFKICTFALIPIGPIEVSMWSFLWNLSKTFFFKILWDASHLWFSIQSQSKGHYYSIYSTWLDMLKQSFCNRLMFWIAFIQMTKYIIYHWNKMLLKKIWHDSLALTVSKYVNVMQFLIQKCLILSSFLNDDTKLIYECFIVKTQHKWPMSVWGFWNN